MVGREGKESFDYSFSSKVIDDLQMNSARSRTGKKTPFFTLFRKPDSESADVINTRGLRRGVTRLSGVVKEWLGMVRRLVMRTHPRRLMTQRRITVFICWRKACIQKRWRIALTISPKDARSIFSSACSIISLDSLHFFGKRIGCSGLAPILVY